LFNLISSISQLTNQAALALLTFLLFVVGFSLFLRGNVIAEHVGKSHKDAVSHETIPNQVLVRPFLLVPMPCTSEIDPLWLLEISSLQNRCREDCSIFGAAIGFLRFSGRGMRGKREKTGERAPGLEWSLSIAMMILVLAGMRATSQNGGRADTNGRSLMPC